MAEQGILVKIENIDNPGGDCVFRINEKKWECRDGGTLKVPEYVINFINNNTTEENAIPLLTEPRAGSKYYKVIRDPAGEGWIGFTRKQRYRATPIMDMDSVRRVQAMDRIEKEASEKRAVNEIQQKRKPGRPKRVPYGA
jgi:hypothetical protein